MRKVTLVGFILLGAVCSCRAGESDVKLTTANGTTKFTVKDSNGNEVASLTSLGTLTVSSNTILTGTTFYQNGSVVLGVSSQSVTVSSNLVVMGAIVANGSAGTSGQMLQSQGPGTKPTWASTGVQYMGITGSTYNGSGVGSLLSANSKCNSAFSGSHMCTHGEILRSGVTSLSATGWVLCDSAYGDNSMAVDNCDGVTTYGANSALQFCNFWTSNSGSNYGFVVTGTGAFQAQACNVSSDIHCCK